MLVLSRKPGQAVTVGNGKVMVVSVSGDKVKLGFEFERDVQIDREEVGDAKRAEQRGKELSPAAP